MNNKQNLHVRKIHTVTYRQGYYHNPTHSEYVLLMEMRRKINSITHINPFTAPVCKSSGLKDAGTSLETVFSTSAFSAVRFDKSLSHVSATFSSSNFTFLSVVFKWHHGSEAVNMTDI